MRNATHESAKEQGQNHATQQSAQQQDGEGKSTPKISIQQEWKGKQQEWKVDAEEQE
jgi:hypothetical protein